MHCGKILTENSKFKIKMALLEVPTNCIFVKELSPFHPREEILVRFVKYSQFKNRPPICFSSPHATDVVIVCFPTVIESKNAYDHICVLEPTLYQYGPVSKLVT